MKKLLSLLTLLLFSGGFAQNITNLKEYDIVMSSPTEFSAYYGNTKQSVLQQFEKMIAAANIVFERDGGFRLKLSPESEKLIFIGSDPYSSFVNYATELSSAVRSRVSRDKYHLAHLVNVGSNTASAFSIGNVCSENNDKAFSQGYQNEWFLYNYFLHEIGHQFGTTHSFTNKLEAGGINTEANMGSTIMANNIKNLPMFSAGAINQMIQYTNRLTCGRDTGIAKSNITINPQQKSYKFPYGTAFMLTVDGNGDYYSIEQNDIGIVANSNPQLNNTSSGPKFTTYMITDTPNRYFPRLSNIKLGINCDREECLVTRARDLKFYYSVRGKYGSKLATVTHKISGLAGNFNILSQNSSVGYAANDRVLVEWNVGGTNANDINEKTVDIFLATDGINFNNTLLKGTPNDGSEYITIPNLVGNTNRIMVKGSTIPFLDINNADFSITQSKPTNLVATQIKTTSAILSWVGSGNFEIYKDGRLLVTTPNSNYTVSGLTLNTVYRFYVKAVGGESTETISITTLNRAVGDVIQPTIPQSLSAVSATSSIRLSWLPSTDNVGILNYSVYVNGVFKASVVGTNYNITGLSRGTTYKLSVMAKDTSENRSNESEIISIKTL